MTVDRLALNLRGITILTYKIKEEDLLTWLYLIQLPKADNLDSELDNITKRQLGRDRTFMGRN